MAFRNSKASYLLILATAVLLVGCASTATPQPDDQSGAPDQPESSDQQEIEPEEKTAPETPDRLEVRLTQTPPAGLERVEIPESAPVTGEVPPEIMEEILADLVDRSGAEVSEITVIRAEAVVWNDGALGCAKPGEVYIQILMNGYWVIAQVEGVEYDYRITDSGDYKLCAGESMPPDNSPDTGEQDQNPLVLQAKEDLAERLGVPVEEIKLLSFKEVVWPDASLGCPQQEMAYAQVAQEGVLIRLGVGREMYFYHSGGDQAPFLCEGTSQIIPEFTPKQDELLPPPGSEID